MNALQLAIASGRTPVWPDVACNSAWLDNSTASAQRAGSGLPKKWTAEDWRGDIEIIPRLPLDGPPSTHRCLVWYYYEEACDLQASAALILETCSRCHYPRHLWVTECLCWKSLAPLI